MLHLLLQLLVHIVNYWAHRAVGECLVEPENKFVLVEVRVRATVVRALCIDSARIFIEERARRGLEEMSLIVLIFFQILRHELLHGESQMSGKALYIPEFQQRSHDFAAICALQTVDLAGYGLVQLMDDRIDFFDRQITGLQETPESPVGIFFLSCQFLDSLGICLKCHVLF